MSPRRAARRSGGSARIELVEGTALALPFDDATFDHLTFTYLLRYVPDPAAAARSSSRVVRPGGNGRDRSSSPCRRAVWRALWELWVRIGLPTAGRAISPGWHEVGTFLGPSIRDFGARFPPERLAADVPRSRPARRAVRLPSLGGGLVLWGSARDDCAAPRVLRARPRRLARLRHAAARHTRAWHLELRRDRRRARARARMAAARVGLLAFFLALGVGAHALDELNGRRSQHASRRASSPRSPRARSARRPRSGSARRWRWNPWLLAFVGLGVLFAVGYNLELFGGRLHGDNWFALAWGAFPLLTGYFGASEKLTLEAGLAARCFAFALSRAQRTLDPRPDDSAAHGRGVSGEIVHADGRREEIDAETLVAAPSAR